MSDYGRYDDDTRTRSRSGEGRGYSRGGDSIFGGGSRGRGDNEMGGWSGSGRTSAYDDDHRQGGRWTQERENFNWGRSRDRDRHFRGGHGHERESSRGWGGNDQGERMSSGWGPDIGRDRSRDNRSEYRGGRDEHRGSGGWGISGGGRETSRGQRGREHERDREQHYGPDDDRDGLPVDETSRLIASNKVEGTAVYGSDGRRLGSIYNFMVDKRSGKVEYAVMSYGGVLGMGTRYYPLPWRVLTYDTRQGGYRVPMEENDLRDAPSFDRSSEPRFDRSYGEHVHGWYGLDY
ncbi:MAG TPA: PRC-barrel domain-containing protein [Allosphingosinicella sp.]|nr:PRC-barrel domain-containing protein [Allosphingosinicella sp.]